MYNSKDKDFTVIQEGEHIKVQIPTSFKDENANGLVDLLNSLSSPDVRIRINAVIPSCDGCGVQTVERFSSIKEAHEEILKLGWTAKDQEIFCPVCSN